MNRAIAVGTSLAASLTRAGIGAKVVALGLRPERTLELYEFESCPFCRKVREALSLLDLEAHIYPCPKGGRRYRPQVVERGGKAQFPYLVDPNTGKEMYESDDIVQYLFERYGAGRASLALSAPVLTNLSCQIASLWRPLAGLRATPARAPEEPLELWSFEASPYSRLVREALCELELPYLLHNVARGSARREAFVARSGKMQVPYLADPNTGTELFESADIVAYLRTSYGLKLGPLGADPASREPSPPTQDRSC